MIKFKYGTRDHRETLEESLETKKYINSSEFKRLMSKNIYHYYTTDYRCNQILFILNDIPKYYKYYTTWIFIEVSEEEELHDGENEQ